MSEQEAEHWPDHGYQTARVDEHQAIRQAQTLTGILAPGTQVAQSKAYEIVEPLGEGGMGKIYRAYDPTMDRYVALKLLKPGVSELEQRRFDREAVIAANFSHPNLVRVLELGSLNETRWMAMEYLRGRDVGEVISNRKQISFRVAVDIFGQALDGLDYIHTRSIAHCDIKPENIFVTRDAYKRKLVIVKLIDFGIARDLDGPIELQNYLSGDPRYMAPEQAILNGPIDHRADLYALGLTFYEVVARRHPFEEHTHKDAWDLLEIQKTEPMPPISPFMPPATPPELLLGLDRFVKTAAAKDPDERFSSALDMKAALVNMLDLVPRDG